ncbi:MAG: peptidoglycan-binding domain-containing protein [Desulfobacteraceae bacterium]|jgi:hypothetical protein
MQDHSDNWSHQFRLALQKRLKAAGVYHETPSGIFGRETKASH